MKKLPLVLIAILLMVCSCQNDIESVATEHMKELMRETLNKPNSAELMNTRAVYKSDSLCIIQFTLKATGNNGNTYSIPIEYIYVDIPDYYGERLRCETATATGGDILSKYWNEGINPIYDPKTVKECKEAGYDLEYLINHSVGDVKSQYRKALLKNAPYKANSANIEDKLTFSAAWVKLMAHGREVTDEKGKDIKL